VVDANETLHFCSQQCVMYWTAVDGVSSVCVAWLPDPATDDITTPSARRQQPQLCQSRQRWRWWWWWYCGVLAVKPACTRLPQAAP